LGRLEEREREPSPKVGRRTAARYISSRLGQCHAVHGTSCLCRWSLASALTPTHDSQTSRRRLFTLPSNRVCRHVQAELHIRGSGNAAPEGRETGRVPQTQKEDEKVGGCVRGLSQRSDPPWSPHAHRHSHVLSPTYAQAGTRTYMFRYTQAVRTDLPLRRERGDGKGDERTIFGVVEVLACCKGAVKRGGGGGEENQG
jgi:hypothetical protein